MQHNGGKYNICLIFASSTSSSSLYCSYKAGKVFLLLTPSLINKSCSRQSDGILNISMQTQNYVYCFTFEGCQILFNTFLWIIRSYQVTEANCERIEIVEILLVFPHPSDFDCSMPKRGRINIK